MPRLLPYLLIAVIVTAHGPAAWAQEPPDETEARKEAARRTLEIMEMRRRTAEEARVRQGEIIRLHTEGKFTHPPKSDLNWRAEPRGGWTIETEPDWDPAARAWNDFASDMSEFLSIAEEISHYRFAPMSERWAVKGIEKRSKDLQKRADAILRFLLDGPSDELGAAPLFTDLTMDGKVAGLNSRVSEIRPKIVQVLVGDTIDVDLYQEVVQELTEIKALTQALRQ
jgi:hypothetical protein